MLIHCTTKSPSPGSLGKAEPAAHMDLDIAVPDTLCTKQPSSGHVDAMHISVSAPAFAASELPLLRSKLMLAMYGVELQQQCDYPSLIHSRVGTCEDTPEKSARDDNGLNLEAEDLQRSPEKRSSISHPLMPTTMLQPSPCTCSHRSRS